MPFDYALVCLSKEMIVYHRRELWIRASSKFAHIQPLALSVLVDALRIDAVQKQIQAVG